MEKKFCYKKALEQAGFSYLGNHAHSMKVRLSEEKGVVTYCVYLAPADLSGYNVCPNHKFCKKFCLNGSGHNKIDILSGLNRIEQARIRKSRLFFENRELFMQILVHEIRKCKRFAEKKGAGFAVRLNGTSDLNPEDFVLNGQNVLEIFPEVQFYDYTKVFRRVYLMDKYPNYDVTYSYSGHNAGLCEKFLSKGGKVAVVFAHDIPDKFLGYPTFDANAYDMRYIDPKAHVMALHYHKTANDYVGGKFIEPDTAFVVKSDDSRCEWAS